MRLCKWDWMLWLDNCAFASRYASKQRQVFSWNENSWKLWLFCYCWWWLIQKQVASPRSVLSTPCKVWAELFPLLKSSLRPGIQTSLRLSRFKAKLSFAAARQAEGTSSSEQRAPRNHNRFPQVQGGNRDEFRCQSGKGFKRVAQVQTHE